MTTYVIAKADLGEGRLPTGRFLSFVDTVSPRGAIRTDALMLVSEDVLSDEMMKKDYRGPRLARVRIGAAINEVVHDDLDVFLGEINGVAFFTLKDAPL